MCSIVQQRPRLVQVVEQRQLLAEEQGGLRKGEVCIGQVLTLMLLGQMKAMAKNVCSFHRF